MTNGPNSPVKKTPGKWALLVMLGLAVLVWIVLEGSSRGLVVCSACGRVERYAHTWGVETSRTAFNPENYFKYHDWFLANVAVEHEHHWLWAGNSSGGLLLNRYLGHAPDWHVDGIFALLPHLEDHEAAIGAARLLVGMDPQTRKEELKAAVYGPLRGTYKLMLFRDEDKKEWSLIDGPEFEEKYRQWRDEREVWKEVLPEKPFSHRPSGG